MMIFSLVVIIGLEKCCITSAYLQWLCHSGERAVARGPLDSILKILMLPLFSMKTYVGGTQQKHPAPALLMSTHVLVETNQKNMLIMPAIQILFGGGIINPCPAE